MEKRQRGRPKKKEGSIEPWQFGRLAKITSAYDEARRIGEKHSVAVREAVDSLRRSNPEMPISEAEVKRRAFMITDNRLTENSVWDERLLGEQLKALSVLELDFSIDVTGFEVGEIDLMIEGLAPASRGKDDPADTIPESGTKPQVTQAGDLWTLDRHRVLCGDARNDAAYCALMQDQRAAAVFSDPPYNDPIDGYVAGFG